jgi:hypothetical protein
MYDAWAAFGNPMIIILKGINTRILKFAAAEVMLRTKTKNAKKILPFRVRFKTRQRLL